MSNLQTFINHLETQVKNHSIYVFGAQGEDYTKISESWIMKMETTPNNANRAIRFWKRQKELGYEKVLRAFDCSGLGMYELNKLFGLPDTTADGMFRQYTKQITKSQLKRGDWVGKRNSEGKVTHIGYVVDDNLNVIESKGRDDGVVKLPLSRGTWNYYGRPTLFEEETKPVKEGVVNVELDVITKGYKDNKENQAKTVQRLLKSMGYTDQYGNALEIDGSFGGKSVAALNKFCKAKGLAQNGTVNQEVWNKLLK